MMKSRLDDIPAYEIRQVTIRAIDYNLVKIALKRICNPLRFEIPRLRTLDFHLENEVWVIVDRSLNDIPIVAWTDFTTQHRSSLHEDILCQQRLYHMHAKIILDKAIEALQLVIGEQLSSNSVDSSDVVSNLTV